MKKIGLTGTIASGKSSVAAVLAEKGALVIDADKIAREVTRVGAGVYHAIVKEFGDQILNDDGTINRQELGKIVFSDPEKLEILNCLTHGPIIAKIKNRLRKLESTHPSDAVVVIDAPLLMETRLTSLVDLVVVVTTDEKRQKERLVSKGLSLEEATSRIGAQMAPEERLVFADLVIENTGTPEELRTKVQEIWNIIKRN